MRSGRMGRKVGEIVLTLAALAFAAEARAGEDGGARELSLQDLLNLKVEVASKIEENVAEAPGVVTVITRQEIENFNALNLADVLNRAPSMQILSSHFLVQAKASIRGLMTNHTDNHVLILINGRPYRDGLGYFSNLTMYTSFPVDLIERIEIVRGPGSVLYGSAAMAGVINIVTRTPEKPVSVSVSGGGGSFGGEMASGTTLLSWRDLKLTVGGNYFNEDGWDLSARTKFGPFLQDSSMPYREDNKAVAAFLEYKRFSAKFSYVDETYDALGFVPFWGAAGTFHNWQLFADLGYTQPITETWKVSLNATRNSWEKFYGGSPVFGGGRQDRPDDATLFEGTVQGELGKKGNFVAGGLAENRANHDISVLDSTDIRFPVMQVFDEWLYSGYASVDYRFIDPFKLIAGFQYNRAPHGKEALVPRLGAIYSFTDAVALKLLYAQAFRVATPLEMYLYIPQVLRGNKNLAPELVTTYDAQLFVNEDGAQYTFTLYYSHLDDIISYVLLHPEIPGNREQSFANMESYHLYGAELEVKRSLSERWYAIGSLTYQREYQDRLFIPDFMGKAGLFHDAGGFKGGLFGSLFGRGMQSRDFNPATEDLNPPAEPIFLLSVSLKYDFSHLAHVPVSVEGYGTNLLDDPMNYPEFAVNDVNTLPMGPGRAFYGKLSLHF